MEERLQKILSSSGLTSRRAAEEWINAGRVRVNGEIAKLGDRADLELDRIEVDGVLIRPPKMRTYLMLNKPRGYVTTLSDEKGRPNAAQLIDCGTRVYPVGRLDMDSEGLLLFTNDGEFANMLMHPSHEVDKTYRVLVQGYTDENLEKLKKPIELDGYTIRTPGVKLLRNRERGQAQLLVTIHEGRNRQVRRMCDAAGMKVLRLQRISEGNVKLGNLEPGKWRYLTPEEVASMK